LFWQVLVLLIQHLSNVDLSHLGLDLPLLGSANEVVRGIDTLGREHSSVAGPELPRNPNALLDVGRVKAGKFGGLLHRPLTALLSLAKLVVAQNRRGLLLPSEVPTLDVLLQLNQLGVVGRELVEVMNWDFLPA